jgi:mono/diheme cytochrome c family protein
MAISLTATSQTNDKMEQAANDFKANCTNCHAENGGGTALGNRLHVKNLYSKEVQEKSTADLAETIRTGKENMPAFGDSLNADQIQGLIDYIRDRARKAH